MENYQRARDRIDVLNSYKNSLIMSGSTVILVLLFGGMAGYVLARFNFIFKATVNTLLIVGFMVPAFATVGIFTFLWSYNDLFLSLVYVSHRWVQPITVLLNQVSTQYGTDLGLQATAVVVTVIPVLIVYIILQNQIIKGLTQGVVKG